MNAERCQSRNGTYCCTRTAGHSGRHESARRITDSRNNVLGVRVSHWRTAYGPVGVTNYPNAPRTLRAVK